MRLGRRLGAALAAALLGAGLTPAGDARAAGDGTTTIVVVDVSGSMADPARIPPEFPGAAELKRRQDAVGRLLELAHPGQKVPLSVIAGGLMGLPDLISLRSQLDDYLKQHDVDLDSISKLAALRAAAGELLAALQLERDHAGVDNRAGLVAFSDDATALAPVTAQVGALAAPIQGLKPEGSTNMGAGLRRALDMLEGQPNPSVILLTDGWNNEGMSDAELLAGPAQRAAAAHVPICTVGLGESPADVDQRLLLDIASRTGGGYHFAGGGTSLGGDLLACHHGQAGQWLGDQRGTVAQGRTAQGGGFTVPQGRRRLTVTLSWPGSELDLRVTDPAGRPAGAGYPGASVSRGAGLVVLTVTNPPAGRWGQSVVGVRTGTAGEAFVATAAVDGATTAPHRDGLTGGGAPLDDVEGTLRVMLPVSAGLAMLLLLLWVAARVRRRFARPAVLEAAVPAVPASADAAAAAVVPAPRRAGSGAAGCIGCLLWLVFAIDLLALVGSLSLLYLWTTPLLTFPG